VSLQVTIYSLADRGWSQRRIARELDINRETVGRHLQLRTPEPAAASSAGSSAESGSDPLSKPAISTAGSEDALEPKPAISTAGVLTDAADSQSSKPAISTAGASAGRRSACERFSEIISLKLEAGLSAQRIHQDLAAEHGFSESYQAVKRFVRRLKEREPERVWRMECQPGEEAQVDFGLGAPIEDGAHPKGRRTWVFRLVLSWSRKAYSEAVCRQDTETFLRCLENAFRHFGGAPLTLNVDNLKAAVLKADWFDPLINPKLAEFCRHYGTHVMPCRPFTPEHKGKVERGVAYVRGNALKGRRFASLAEENRFLSQWESGVADRRIHGTTRRQVGSCFEEERPHLLPLPASLFPAWQEARRRVHRDSFVALEKAFYEAPPELIGRDVWVRWDGRCVRIFNDRLEQVAMHARLEPGRFSRTLGAAGLSRPVRASCNYWVDRAAVLGEECRRWAERAVHQRGPEALRSIMALCNLIRTHSGTALNRACARALEGGACRLKDVRRLLGEEGSRAEQGRFAFQESHALIRDLSAYGDFVNADSNQPDPHHDEPHQQPQSPGAGASSVRAA
jgi:transposase